MPAQTLRYIVLATSNVSLSKKFRVLQGDFSADSNSQRAFFRGPAGNLMTQDGSRWRSWVMVVKAYHTDPDAAAGYGNLDDLRVLFGLNNPLAAANNRLTLQDLVDSDSNGVGDIYTVMFMMPALQCHPLSPMHTGVGAFYAVPLQMVEIN